MFKNDMHVVTMEELLKAEMSGYIGYYVSPDENNGIQRCYSPAEYSGAFGGAEAGLTIKYLNPEVPTWCYTANKLSSAPIFTGGYAMPEVLRMIHPGLGMATVLTGCYSDTKKEFTVHNCGLNYFDIDMLIVLRPYDEKTNTGLQNKLKRYGYKVTFHAINRLNPCEVWVIQTHMLDDIIMESCDSKITGVLEQTFSNAMLRAEPNLFVTPYSHNPAAYSDGWAMDDMGVLCDPDSIDMRDDHRFGRTSEAGWKTWSCRDKDLIYLSCETWSDGSTHLTYQYSPYYLHQFFRRNKPLLSALQTRRMAALRKEIIEKLKADAKRCDRLFGTDFDSLQWKEVRDQYTLPQEK